MTEDLFNRKSLRQALKQWTAVARLSRHPLTNLHLVTARVLPQMSNEVITPTDRAQALRQVLREAIDTLKPTADEPDFTAREWRDYLILSEQYLNRRQAQALRDMLALSESGYFHEQKRALDRLGSYLRQQENALQAAAESVLHLPFYPTPFLGREKELQQIASLLAKPECRLLTLMGPGGVGKTRLAVQALSAQADQWLHGIYFVPLAGLVATAELASAVTTALGLTMNTEAGAKQKLLHFLRRKQMLLVLDNFEHLQERAELLLDILQAAPAVKLLITSRISLNLGAEWLYEVEGLPYPQTEKVTDLNEFTATRLFLVSALRAQAKLVLTETDAPPIARICQIVEGLPLAVELAASMVRTHTCPQIAMALHENIALLTTTKQDLPERHRSIQAVFAQTWRLLPPAEQAMLLALSVFRGGFDMEAAMAVAGVTAVTITNLINQSVLQRISTDEEHNAPRYAIHELLRQYIHDKLIAQPETETAVRNGHSRYYAAFLHTQAANLTGPQVVEALAVIQIEIDNARSAWQWAVDQAHLELLQQSLVGLARFHHRRGLLHEGEKLVRVAVERVQSLPTTAPEPDSQRQTLLCHLLVEQARFLNEQANYEAALAAAKTAVNLAATTQNIALEAEGYLQIGHALLRQTQHDAAQEALHRALALAQEAALTAVEAETLVTLYTFHYWLSADYKQAHNYAQQALHLYEQLGDPKGEADALYGLAVCCLWQKEQGTADYYLAQALARQQALDDQNNIGRTLNAFGILYWNEGNFPKALEYCHQAARLAEKHGNRHLEMIALNNISGVYWQSAKLTKAERHFEQAIAVAREIKDRSFEGVLLERLGHMYFQRGDYGQARLCYDQALSIWQAAHQKRQEGELLSRLGLLHCRLGAHTKARILSEQGWQLGQTMDDDVAYNTLWTNLGWLGVEMGDLPTASDAFKRALYQREMLPKPYQVMKPLAGLAHIALINQDPVQALALVEDILTYLEPGAPGTEWEPYRVHLVCYETLRACGDPRAVPILAQTYAHFRQWISQVEDTAAQQMYQHEAFEYQLIAAAYEAAVR